MLQRLFQRPVVLGIETSTYVDNCGKDRHFLCNFCTVFFIYDI